MSLYTVFCKITKRIHIFNKKSAAESISPGLEHVKIVRNAYAIEYDCINPRQLYPSLEFKEISGLFSGGQFNGSSGYEEAAAHIVLT